MVRNSQSWVGNLILATTLLLAALLLFTSLGHYPLWDDEAQTCLIARGVARTGDTSAILGQNIVAYRQGLLIRNFKERSSPPLQFYLAAPFVGKDGTSAFAARLPFACFGLATIGLILIWSRQSKVDWMTLAVLCIGIMGNVSLFLYLRQARYYAPMIFFSVAVAYSYWHLQSRRGMIIHTLLSLFLLASNYLAYGAWMGAMVADYLIWGRKRRPIRGTDWLILLGPQVLLGGLILLIWNPLRISSSDPSSSAGWLADRFTLLWRTLRDADRCEFACTALILVSIPVAIWKRNVVLIRALTALAIMLVLIDFASPQSPRAVETADVRYFASLIPLAMFIGVLALRLIAGRRRWIALVVAPIAFLTNWLDVSAWKFASPRSTLVKFVHELGNPPPDPYSAALAWLKGNVESGQSLAALPSYCTYPLMYHAPQLVYGWQLTADQRNSPEFKYLAPLNFFGQDLPDYVICFGPSVAQLLQPGTPYRLTSILDVFCQDQYRPELMWRTFGPVPFDREHGTAVYVVKRLPMPQSSSPQPPSAPAEPTPQSSSPFRL